MMRKVLLTLSMMLWMLPTFGNSEVDLVHQRLFDYYYNESSTSGITLYRNTQLADGSWANINYSDRSITNWAPLEHLLRIRVMAKAFHLQSNSSYYHNAALLNAIEKGLTYWYNANCKSDNWFFNDIAQQREIGPILILMKGYISESVRDGGCNYLVYPLYNHAGTNLVWISSCVLMKGIVKEELATISTAVEKMGTTIDLTLNEGIQYDYSFLYHGKQLYNGGYGSWLIGDVSLWMYYLRGLSFGFSQNHINNLTNLLLEGDRWMVRKNLYDFSATGRNLTRKNGIGSTHLINFLERLEAINPSRSQELAEFRTHIGGGANTLTGVKHFWRADYFASQAPDYYFGIKMCSSRTNGTEYMNGENSKGFWLPFGATCLLKTPESDLKNIFPLWDWTKIPGITCPETLPTFGSTQSQSQSFVGGVSDGEFGVATINLNKELTTAKKSWFVFGNRILALGAAISSTHLQKVNTSINQCFLTGAVTIDGQTAPISANQQLDGTSWVHHNNTGYVLLQPDALRLSNVSVQGNWYDINTAQPNAMVNGDVFKLWIEHGSKPSNDTYAYAILPQVNLSAMQDQAQMTGIHILSNTGAVQAIHDETNKITGIVFHSAGQVVVDGDLTIGVDKPCMLLVDQSSNPLKISVADPSQRESAFSVTLQYNGYPDEILSINLPLAGMAGSTITEKTETFRIEKLNGIYIDEKYHLPLSIGEDVQISYQVNISGQPNPSLLWTSSDPSVLSVDQVGSVAAHKLGNATIKASYNNEEFHDACVMYVKEKRFDQTMDLSTNTIILPGATWDVQPSYLSLTAPVGASVPSPVNNTALLDIPIEGDFVFSTKASVEATSSSFNDFVVIWGHQYMAESYSYAHFSENNDNAGSGLFEVLEGDKSAEISDITKNITGDTWYQVDVWRINNKLSVYLNQKLVASFQQLGGKKEYLGVGSYNDVCSFKDFQLWNTTLPTSVKEVEPKVAVEVFKEGGQWLLKIPQEWIGANMYLTNLSGQRTYIGIADSQLNPIDFPFQSTQFWILSVEKDGRRETRKIVSLLN